jgi:hypothetical protein
MQAQPDLMALDPFRAAMAFGDDFVFLEEPVRRLLEGLLGPEQAGVRLAA